MLVYFFKLSVFNFLQKIVMDNHPTHFKAHDLPPHHSISKSRNSNATWIIVICILFVLFLIWNKRSQVSEFFGLGQWTWEVSSGLRFGESVSIEWEIRQDGDFVTHTHKLYTESSWVFGLKSKTINLNQYSGFIAIEWVIDTENDGIYIIEVNNIISEVSTSPLETEILNTGATSSNGVYLAKAGIYFVPWFEDEYTLDNSGENGKISLTHTTTNQKITISYFACKNWDSNKDCAQLKQTFSDSNDKTFTTTNDDTYYKLSEVNSWFFTNIGLFGYFINDIPEQEVISISNYVVLPTTSYVSSNITTKFSPLCKQGNIVMTTVNKSNLYLEKWVPTLKISGIWDKGTVDCNIQLDPSLSSLWILSSFDYKDTSAEVADVTQVDTPQEDTKPVVSQSNNTLTVEAWVKQFAITLDKTLEFVSSRWHTIIFPSRKISYQSNNVSSDLGTKWVNCYVQTNVIDYARKDLLLDSPTAKIYECKMKSDVVLAWNYISIPLDDGRTFVVEAVDSAWVDFANNVKVVLNS